MSPAPRTGSEMEEEVKLEGRYKTIKSSGPGPKDLQNSEVTGSSRYQWGPVGTGPRLTWVR